MQISLKAYNREIEELLENDQIDEVIAHCRHILQEFPRHLDTLRTFGKATLDNGNLEASTTAFKQLLGSLPSDFVANLGLSFINQNQGDLEKAIWYLERVYESNPNNVMVQEELKKLMTTRDGKMPDRLNKTNAILAQIYANSGEYLRALEEITTILADDPDRTDMRTLLVKVYESMNDPRRTLEACEECFKDNPYNFEALRIALRTAYKAGAEEHTQEWTQRLMELDPYAIDPVTNLMAEEKNIPDDTISLDRLEWIPGVPAVEDVSDEPASEGMGTGDLDLTEGQDAAVDDFSAEPVEEIPVEQETPKWLKDLLSEARGSGGKGKFDRAAGETIPDWVRKMEADEPIETAPGLVGGLGSLNAVTEEKTTAAIQEPAENLEAEPDRGWEFGEWKPISSEKTDPLEPLAATRKSNRIWYAEHVSPANKAVEDLESLAQTRKTSHPIQRGELENLSEAVQEPFSEESGDWRDNLDLDWIGEPRTESAATEPGETSQPSAVEAGKETPDLDALDWLGDLSKPEGETDSDWLGDVSRPQEEEASLPESEIPPAVEGMEALLGRHLPDAPNVMLPEGSMLPKEPIELIPKHAIEEETDPAGQQTERNSEENSSEVGPDEDVNEDAGEDFYQSLQNPSASTDQTRLVVEDEQTMIGNIGAPVGGEIFPEPIEEILPEAEISELPGEITAPNRFQSDPAPSGRLDSEPFEELPAETEFDEITLAADEPVEEIVAEAEIEGVSLPLEIASEELEETPTETMIEKENQSVDEPIEEIIAETVIDEVSAAQPNSNEGDLPEVEEVDGALPIESMTDQEGLEEFPSESGAETNAVPSETSAPGSTEESEWVWIDEPVEEIVAEDSLDLPRTVEEVLPAEEALSKGEPASEIALEGMALTESEPVGEPGGSDEEMLNPESFEDLENEPANPESVSYPSSENQTEEAAREEQFIGSAFDRGKRFLDNGNLDKALAEFSDLIKFERMIDQVLPMMEQLANQHPGNKRVLRVLGDAYFNADRLDEALDTYARADDLPDIPNEKDIEP